MSKRVGNSNASISKPKPKRARTQADNNPLAGYTLSTFGISAKSTKQPVIVSQSLTADRRRIVENEIPTTPFHQPARPSGSIVKPGVGRSFSYDEPIRFHKEGLEEPEMVKIIRKNKQKSVRTQP